jgi:hypothetical protein
MNGKVRLSYWPWLFVLSFFFAGCASVLSGPSQSIEINSNIPGIGVYKQGQYLGSTPLKIELQRQSRLTLTLERKGFVSRTLTLKTRTNGNVWWNLPFTVFGLTGISTDYGSGAVYEYSPHRFYVIMRPVKALRAQDGADEFSFLNRDALREEKARHQFGPYARTLDYLNGTR